ncbi:MAG: hypothetical protein RJA61_737, partial [Candidatus Parcubacteria bacterium]
VVYREGVNEGFTTIAAGNGTGAEATDTISSAPEVDASVGLTDQFKGNRRSIWGFDTSSIPDADTVSSATFSLVVNSNANTLGNFDVYITPVNPSSASSLTSSDYQNAFTRTSYGSKALSTYTDNNSTYNDIALNGTGISAINKTSNTFLGGMHSWDFNQSFTGTWVSNSESRLRPRFADETGTAKDPKLVVEHTAAEEGLLQDISYTYDTVGNITNMLDVSETGAGKAVVFGYDDLYRLTSASTTAATSTPYTQTYTYNSIGNILTKSDQGTYTYGETGYINPHATTDINGTTLVYDNNGNLTSFGNKGYIWDYRNRMTASGQTGSATTTYAYDHTVQRVWKVTGNATTTYPSMYFDTKGATTTRHIFDTTGILIATVEGNGIATSTNYVHIDHLGGTNVVTDENGEAVQVLDYYPYGNERISSGTDSTNRYYIGERLDDESDLNYLNARYYESARGQFLSQDPVFWEVGISQEGKNILRSPQLLNSYSYAGNNPITSKDPSGRCPHCLIGAGAAMLGQYGYDVYNNINTNGFSAGAFYSNLSSPEIYAVRGIQGAIVAGTGGLVTGFGITAQIGTVGLASGITGAGGNYTLGQSVTLKSFITDTFFGGLTFGLLKGVSSVPGRSPNLGTNAFYFGKHTQQNAQILGVDAMSNYVGQLVGGTNFGGANGGAASAQSAAKALGIGNTGSGTFAGTYNFGPGVGTFNFGTGSWVSTSQSTPTTINK